MNELHFFSSLTRISDLDLEAWDTEPIPRAEWSNGDYVLGAARTRSQIPVELTDGRMVEALRGDRLVGALGRRAATLEAVGSFEALRDGEDLQLLTGAGLLGKATSAAPWMPPMLDLEYLGHVVRGGKPVRMADFALPALTEELDAPIVMMVGTSMSAGKTTAARCAIRSLVARGLRVTGAKLTGAGRYKDILAMRDAGAAAVLDFVDGGLPSTVCSPEEYRRVLAALLSAIAATRADVVVVEAGSSPLEAYNGETLLDVLGDCVRCRILAASDPYAVVGVRQGFGWEPDLVTGPAANTRAGIELVERLTGLTAVNVFENSGRLELDAVLARTLEL